MTIFTSRDFETLNVDGPSATMYALSLFLHHVMDWSIVGNTQFNITGSQLFVTSGTNASINLDPGFEDFVLFPSGTYEPTIGDVTASYILVLKSTEHPRMNSGLFRFLGTGSFSGSTALQIDYRSTQDPPPQSASLDWAVYRSESHLESFVISTSPNTGVVGYHGAYPATTSKIILQSPHSSSWQVRLCRETDLDENTHATVLTRMSIAPGFGGNSRGDFQILGDHLHSVQFFNTEDSQYGGGVVGWDMDITSVKRLYLWGEQDNTPGSFIMFGRSTVLSSTDFHAWSAFGFCEDETQPLPSLTIQRMFTMGNSNNINAGAQGIPFWETGASSGNRGVIGFGLSKLPVIGGVATWTTLQSDPSVGPGGSHPIYSLLGKDNEYLNATELIPNDVWIGVANKSMNSNDPRYQFEPRRLGRFPLARMGRENFGDFTVTSDADHSWIHMFDGVYLPWSGTVTP